MLDDKNDGLIDRLDAVMNGIRKDGSITVNATLLRECRTALRWQSEEIAKQVDAECKAESRVPSSIAPTTVGPLVRGEAGDWIDAVALDIAELGDRTSPDDQPEMMLVTAAELRRIILVNVPCAPSASAYAKDAARYRYIRQPGKRQTEIVECFQMHGMDEAIDRALASDDIGESR